MLTTQFDRVLIASRAMTQMGASAADTAVVTENSVPTLDRCNDYTCVY